ncbi:ribosomal protein S11 [Onchocerca flexuosa]|uniref:Ribosomal protein S11 n=1 Tax=Onchocerca flexuosa TaxID=387005 RepID=A0A238BSE9_9BILA|nr:ribosomal protein S11 [Onchocerca flexuosa]
MARNISWMLERLLQVMQPSYSHTSRFLSFSPKHPKSIKEVSRVGVDKKEMQRPISEGTVGGSGWVPVNLSNFYDCLPTVEIFKQQFDGIAFEELPIVHVKASRNNTLITVTDHKYNIITYTSCRLEGFKNARKKTNIAGQTTGVAAGQRLIRRGIRTVRVLIRGLGPGRMTSIQGMATAGVKIVSITEHSALPELGPRPKKIPRI